MSPCVLSRPSGDPEQAHCGVAPLGNMPDIARAPRLVLCLLMASQRHRISETVY